MKAPQEIRTAIADAKRNYDEAEAESSNSTVTAYRLGYLRGLEDALSSVKWEEYRMLSPSWRSYH